MDSKHAHRHAATAMYHVKDWVGGDARPQRISKLSFGILSGQDVINAAELEITNKALFVLPTRTPAKSGVLDRRMGTSRRGEMCETCGKITRLCPGHFAYIELEMPCFHIGYFKHVVHILQCVCKTCSRVLLSEGQQEVHRQKLKECVSDSRATGDMFKKLCDRCKRVTCCPHCGASNGQVKKLTGTKTLKIVHDIYKKGKRSNGKAPFPEDRKTFMDNFKQVSRTRIKDLEVNLNNAQDDLTPLRALRLFEAIRDFDLRLLRMSTGSRPEWMIMTYIPVPPPCLRPSVYSDGGAGGSNEDDLTVGLQGIVNLNTALRQHIQKGASMKQIQDTFDGLQFCVAQYINSDLPGFPQTIKGGNEKQKRSLCQRLKGKAGRFRGNLSGKRVDFSARTVISPDPNLKITEVGVPLLIAKKLTYPEVVNRYNIERLREAVRNGFHVYPGANYFEAGVNGFKKSLKYGNLESHAQSLQIGDIVERHLIDGDIVLFNRQPSLHKQSIMAHTVRVLEGRTFRFNECVCAPYNADFDGDEMNLHVPQTEEARAEALELMGVMNNICTPKNGAPLVSATQDFITSSFLLTQNDVFMTRGEFCKTVTFAGDGLERLTIPEPAICHPVQLWTGKQVVSMLLRPNDDSKTMLNFEMKERNYEGNRKGAHPITHNSPYLCPNEGYTVFHNSELVCGNLTKSSLAGRGLFYFLERYYGPRAAAECMNRLTKMCTRWLTDRGFSIGIDDVTASAALTQKKQVLVKEGYARCDKRIAEYAAGTLELKAGCNLDQSLESEMNKELSTIRDTAGQMCMRELPWHNSPRIMSVCGSKGSSLNICQMVAAVGQQTVNGSRAPDGFVNRSLPHFRVGAKHPAAKGFVANSFYSGLTAPEFFFHTMGGREGLVDTAVKTAKTGYMSRRLMKTLEDLSAQYDRTVRNSTSAVIQFRYGDDGLHPVMMESGVHPVNLGSLWDHVFNMSDDFATGSSSASLEWGLDVKVKDENDLPEGGNVKRGQSITDADAFLTPSQMLKIAASILKNEFKSMFGGSDSSEVMIVGDDETEESFEYFDHRFVQDLWDFIKKKSQELASLDAIFTTDNGIGSAENKGKILSSHQHRVARANFVEFIRRVIKTFERSRVEPGEALGAVGAQSLGEPGTQMTLKTFHFAGVASMNVTLGVPRINELMNASKKTSTPIITAQLEDKVLKSDGSETTTALGKDGKPIMPPAFNKVAARMVRGRIEVTTLGEVSKHISENLSDQDYTVSVTLDTQTIEDLCLELTLEDVELAIQGEKRLQLKQRKCHQLIRQNNTDTLTIKLGMPEKKDKKDKDKDLFFEAQRIKNILCDIPVAGFRTISRAVVSVMEKESESSQAKKCMAEDDISGRSAARVVREIRSGGAKSMFGPAGEQGVEEDDDDVEMSSSSSMSSDYSSKERYQLICEGRGLLSVMGTAGVDGRRTMSNDITEVNAVLGIEAARQSIQNEIGYVYSQYGLGIDPRHLMLLSDVMTYRGEILGINRFGIAKMKESVLMLASFEKTPDHLFDAAVHGAVDTIDGVSECIIMGTPIPLGTGMFKLRRDHEMAGAAAAETKADQKPVIVAAPVPIMRRLTSVTQ